MGEDVSNNGGASGNWCFRHSLEKWMFADEKSVERQVEMILGDRPFLEWRHWLTEFISSYLGLTPLPPPYSLAPTFLENLLLSQILFVSSSLPGRKVIQQISGVELPMLLSSLGCRRTGLLPALFHPHPLHPAKG